MADAIPPATRIRGQVCSISECGNRLKTKNCRTDPARSRKRVATQDIAELICTYTNDRVSQGDPLCQKCEMKYLRMKAEPPNIEYGVMEEESCVKYLMENYEGFTRANKIKVMKTIGKSLHNKVRKFAESHRHIDKSANTLAKYENFKYLESVPDELKMLVEAISSDNSEPKHKVRAVEAICQMQHKNFYSKLAFMQSAVIASLTNSKTSLQIMSSCLPSGSTMSFRRFLENHASVPQLTLGVCDTITIFDNQQIIGKNWNVSAYSKQRISKCTAVLHTVYKDSFLQLDTEFDLTKFLGPGHVLTGTEDQLAGAVTLTEDEANASATDMKQLYTELFPRADAECKINHSLALSDIGYLIEHFDLGRSCSLCDTLIETPYQSVCHACRAPIPTIGRAFGIMNERAAVIRGKAGRASLSKLVDPVFADVPQGPQIGHKFCNDDPSFLLPDSKAGCLGL